MSRESQEHGAGGREFEILGDATEKLRAPNAVRANGTVSRLVFVVLCSIKPKAAATKPQAKHAKLQEFRQMGQCYSVMKRSRCVPV